MDAELGIQDHYHPHVTADCLWMLCGEAAPNSRTSVAFVKLGLLVAPEVLDSKEHLRCWVARST